MEQAVEVSIIDPLDDPNLDTDPFFVEADWCLVIEKPDRILHVRDQGRTDTCYAFVVTACMFGDEVHTRGNSSQGSTQEYLDYIHEHKRPKYVIEHFGATGPFPVKCKGYTCSYQVAFGYVIKRGLSPESIYPWVGKPQFSRCDGGAWNGKAECNGREITPGEKFFIQNYKKLEGHKEVEDELKNRPVTGCIKLTDALRWWHGGEIYKAENVGNGIGGHAVTIVGYGGRGEDSYYLCQNSYGLGWGYRGYFKARRDLISRTYIPVDTCSPGEGLRKNEEGSTVRD